MTETAGGSGEAHDATVATVSGDPDAERLAAGAEQGRLAAKASADARVKAARSRIAKAKGHLAGAHESLARALAEQKGI